MRRARVRTIGKRRALYGLGDDETGCLKQATEASAALWARTDNVSKTWRPATTYFLPADVLRATSEIMPLLRLVRAKVLGAPGGSWVLEDTIGKQTVLNRIDRQLERGSDLVTASAEATAKKFVVNAPDFKTWVLQSLLAASDAVEFATFRWCKFDEQFQYILSGELQYTMIGAMFDNVVGIVMKIFSVAKDAAKGVVDAVSSLVKAIDTALKVVVYGGAAYFIYDLFLRDKR